MEESPSPIYVQKTPSRVQKVERRQSIATVRTSDIKGREIRERFSRRDWHSRLIHACLIFACSLKRLAGHHSAFFFPPFSSEVSLRAENCPPPLFQRISRRSSVGRKEIFAFAFLFRVRNGTFDRFRNVLTFDTF